MAVEALTILVRRENEDWPLRNVARAHGGRRITRVHLDALDAVEGSVAALSES